MFVLAVRFELRLREVSSLKDKRARIRPVVDRIRHRLRLSVSEVGHQDRLDRAALGVAVVAPTEGRARELMDEAERVVWAAAGVEVIDVERSWLEPD